MSILKTSQAAFILVLLAFMISCGGEKKESTTATTPAEEVQKAICVLYPTEGNTVSGIVTFTKSGNTINVEASLEGLTPGDHGFHIHQFGDCSASDGSSAGGHFNPGGQSHGGMMDDMRHEGDMGNIVADSLGFARLEFTNDHLAFEGALSIIGKALVVHKSMDDLKTQPTGNSGARVACGVIGLAKQ